MGKLSLPKLKIPNLNLSFQKKQQLSLGLDIGSHGVKICEMTESSSGLQLVSLGSALLPPDTLEDGALQDPDAVAQTIASLVNNLKIKGKKVAISISGYSVIVKKINLPIMSDDELAKHIQSEAEQYIPFDIDDVYLDYEDLKTSSEAEQRTDVMLVAAKKDVVDGYLNMLQSAGLKPVVVDVDAFALENAYEANFGLSENVTLVDIGASKMNINIISQGTSTLARDVVLGSRQITEQIQNQFDLSFEEAESLKVGQIEAGDKRRELARIFENTCNQWVNEVKRAVDFYFSNYPGEKLSRIILSGGGSRVKGLTELFQKEIEIPTEVFNPFAKAAISKSIDPAYLKYVAPEMTLAAGLATRPVEL